MKLLKVAAIAAIVFSGSALAGVVPQYGGGGNHGGGGNNSGPNSELNIYQYGGGNSALVNRPGFPGECFICELRLP
ncbi:hypothetical protein FSJ62_023545, partial [Escherichia coli]|nr:hypothetical protein [Escherichia coli]